MRCLASPLGAVPCILVHYRFSQAHGQRIYHSYVGATAHKSYRGPEANA